MKDVSNGTDGLLQKSGLPPYLYHSSFIHVVDYITQIINFKLFLFLPVIYRPNKRKNDLKAVLVKENHRRTSIRFEARIQNEEWFWLCHLLYMIYGTTL